MALYPRMEVSRPFRRIDRLFRGCTRLQPPTNRFDTGLKNIVGSPYQPGLNGLPDELLLLWLKLNRHTSLWLLIVALQNE